MNKKGVGQIVSRNVFSSFLVLLFVVLCAGLVSAALTSITVTDPNGGEYWSTDQNVTWTSVGCTGDENVNIWLYNEGLGTTAAVTSDVNCALQYYQWDTTTVSDDNDYKIYSF